jgi:hypothetical protein
MKVPKTIFFQWLILVSSSLFMLSFSAFLQTISSSRQAQTLTMAENPAINVLSVSSVNPIVVDHTSVSLFDQIPPEYLDAARSLRLLFINRSVGSNINDGLNCLSYPTIQQAPNHCKRPSLDASELVVGTQYSRPNWTYQFWESTYDTGLWSGKTPAFLDMANRQLDQFDVFSFQMSYLEVDQHSTITSPTGFFYNDPRIQDVYDIDQFERNHPEKTVFYMTSSLSRSIGTPVSELFNQKMRQFSQENNKILFDVADILAHDPQGNPCFDNRDGIQYCTTNGNCENHPDDGLNIPAICKEYTSETEGGHLGSQSTGKIRVAKAFWVLMAQIAGWQPDGVEMFPYPPTPTPGSYFQSQPYTGTKPSPLSNLNTTYSYTGRHQHRPANYSRAQPFTLILMIPPIPPMAVLPALPPA